MDYDIAMKRQPLELLDEIGELDQKEIEKHYKGDALVLARMLLWELTDGEGCSDPITPTIFAELMQRLRKVKRMWGRKLGDAIILSADRVQSGNFESAIIGLKEFIRSCPSRYFKEHAQNQIDYYKRKREDGR
jgi:hypothetical protein